MPSHALPGEQPVADVAGRRAPDPRPPGAAAARAAPAPRARRRATATTSAIATSGIDERTGDGSTSRTTTVRTTCTTCPAERSQATARSPRPTSLDVATVADPAVDVAHDPAGQRDVEEQRPVVRRHRSGQRQVDAETAGHDLPAPGAAHGGQHREARRCRQRPAVDRADAVEERARAQAPDQDGERRGGAREAGPRPRGPAHPRRPICARGRTSRSAWSTVTASCPARPPPDAGARRRRSRRPARAAARTRRPPSPVNHSAARSASAAPSRQGLGRTRTSAPSRPNASTATATASGPSRRPPAGRAALVGVEGGGHAGVQRIRRGRARRDRRRTASAGRDSPRRRRRSTSPASSSRGQQVEQRRGGDEGRAGEIARVAAG